MALQLTFGEASAIGPRAENQDAIRVVTPAPALAASKGYLFALADGVSQCADGGLAARAWLDAVPGADQRVDRIVTIGSPHHGTWLAQFSRVNNGRQMRIGGDWLRSLQAREAVTAPNNRYDRFVCWYSNADNIVFPAATAMLPGADNRHVPGVSHVAMAFHPQVMRETLALLIRPSAA